jgi:hypothetical protein
MDTESHWVPLFGGDTSDSWRARHASLFPSDESLRHWFRQHKRELVRLHAVVYHRGKYHATSAMTPAVLAIASRAAQRSLVEQDDVAAE